MGSLVTFNKLSSGNRAAPTTIGGLTYSLPYPRELRIRTDYGWKSTALGTSGSAVASAIKAQGDSGYNMDAVFAFGQKIYDQSGAVAAGIAGGISEGAAAGASFATRQIINPKLEVLFEGVTHREFELTFDLAPTTAVDSVNTIDFLKQLHLKAAPDTDLDAFMKYPETVTVVIAGEGTVINRGNCAITSIDANLTPDGVWATFKNGKPVHVTVTIGFLELQLPTKANDEDLFG